MKTRRPITRLRRAVTVAAVACLATTATAALTATPATAADSTVSNVTLSVSNNVEGATTTATYTWGFTLSAGTGLTGLTLTIPSHATWTPSAGDIKLYGLVAAGCTLGTPSFATPTITLALSSCADLSASTAVAVTIANITNGASADSTFTTAVGFNSDAGVPAASATPIASNSTTVNIIVPESLTFTNAASQSSISVLAIPGGSVATASPNVSLEVQTNAAKGYELSGCVTTDFENGTSTASFPQGAFDSSATDVTTSAFGASAGVSGTGATAGTAWASPATTYVGYPNSCDDTTQANGIMYNQGPTAGDTLTLTNAAVAKALQPGGTYSGAITYVATPTY